MKENDLPLMILYKCCKYFLNNDRLNYFFKNNKLKLLSSFCYGFASITQLMLLHLQPKI